MVSATTDKNGDDESLVPTAELKPLLHLAKRQPLSCAVAMSKAKRGIVLMHRRTKPKKLLAELKAQAKAKGIELDTTSLRFGRVSVDGASDAGMATFTVNKPAPGVMRRALLDQVRPAGLQRCEIVVDTSLENETDEDNEGQVRAGPLPDATPAAAPPHAGSKSAENSAHPNSRPEPLLDSTPATNPTAPVSGRGQPDTAGVDSQANTASTVSTPANFVRARLTGLGLRAKKAIASGSPQTKGIRAAAVQARAALASGNMAQVGQAADTMEQLLSAEPLGLPAELGTQEHLGMPAAVAEQGSAGTLSGVQPNRVMAVRANLTAAVRRIADADPANRYKLVALGNVAQTALTAGDLDRAAAGTEELRRALDGSSTSAPDTATATATAAAFSGNAANPAIPAGTGRSMGTVTGLPGLDGIDENGRTLGPQSPPTSYQARPHENASAASRVDTGTPPAAPMPLAPALVGPMPRFVQPPVAPPPVTGPSWLSRLAGRAISVLLSAEAATATAGAVFVAILVVPTNRQSETLREPVEGHPELTSRLERPPGDLSGILTIRSRGGNGQAERDVAQMFFDYRGLHPPGGSGPILGDIGPEGVHLTPEGEAYLLGRLSPELAPGAPQDQLDAGKRQPRKGTPGMPQAPKPDQELQQPSWLKELEGIETHDEEERRFIESLAMGGMKHDEIVDALEDLRAGRRGGVGAGGGTGAAPTEGQSPKEQELAKRKSIIEAHGLPTGGRVPYIPPKTWTSSQPLPRGTGSGKGYLDRKGAEWVAPKGNLIGPRHWDVQLPGGGHLNVTSKGEIDHG